MCDSCLSDHKEKSMYEGHKSVDITDSLFCQKHSNIVTAFCLDCQSGICPRCAVLEHENHNIEDIQAMASQSQDKVNDTTTTRARQLPDVTAPASVHLGKPITELTLKTQIKLGPVLGLGFLPKFSQLAVRAGKSIQVYGLTGTLVRRIGRGIQGLDGNGLMSFDPQRDLYLAPCGDHLTTIDLEGDVHDVIQVKGSKLWAVVHCSSTDQYVVTDLENHRLVIIDARTRKVVNSFGSKGIGADQFDCPQFVDVGDIQGRATIVVCDFSNNAVKLFDPSKSHVHTYGSFGQKEGQLRLPWDVSVDPAGRVVVCDRGNSRVVSFWSEGDKDHWQCLLSKEQLGGWPEYLDIDPTHKLVAVCVNVHGTDTIQLYTYN